MLLSRPRHLVTMCLVTAWTAVALGQDSRPAELEQLEMELRRAGQRLEQVAHARDEMQLELEQARMQLHDAMTARDETSRRAQEAQELSEEVMEEAHVSARTVPELVHRLESEQFSLELERIGLEVRVKAVSEAMERAKQDDKELSHLAQIEMKVHEEQLAAMKKRYDQLKKRLDEAQQAGLDPATKMGWEGQLLGYEAQLQATAARREASMLRAKMALKNPPQVKELAGDLRRAAIELRVIEAKLRFIGEKLENLRRAASIADKIVRLRGEVQDRRSASEQAIAQGKRRVRALESKLHMTEKQAVELEHLRAQFEDQLAELKDRIGE